MRFIFHNPHTLWFKKTMQPFLANRRSINKYDYFFDYFYNSGKKVFVYIDNSSSNPIFLGFLKFLNIPLIEFIGWIIINKLNILNFKIILNHKKLKKTDILWIFYYDVFANQKNIFFTNREMVVNRFRNISAFKVVHLSHYGYNVCKGSKNCEEAKIDLFVSENNLYKNSEYFRVNFSWYNKDVYVLPYIPDKRFQKNITWHDRKNKAIATGSITYPMTDAEFVNFYNDNRLQPMREVIYKNASEITDYVDSIISDIRDASTVSQTVNKDKYNSKVNSFLNKYYIKRDIYVLLKIVKLVFSKPLDSLDNDRNYYKIDIVNVYNEYKMCIVPEEVINLPGIGFVEGIACGCAYIGIRDPMYADIGLIDDVNYIGYDGSLTDLINKISYFQKNQSALEEIVKNSCKWLEDTLDIKRLLTKMELDFEYMMLEHN